MTTKLAAPLPRRRKGDRAERLRLAAGGLEAEFTLMVDDAPARPEEVFRSPRGFIRGPLMHRVGRSFHLPTGAAIYFDTGVVEIATPPMELERGCFGRLARSLWESLHFVRGELDAWEQRHGRRVRLQGFSAHYNVSVEGIASLGSTAPGLNHLAWILTHVLPAPVMLLATNVASTGVGVRPRAGRLEITADFSPDPMRTAATGSLVAGIVSAIARWPSPTLAALARARVPIVDGFAPMRHTSRKGWLARADCYAANPFECDPDAAIWRTPAGEVSLRGLALGVADAFDDSIRAFTDPVSYTLARRILSGDAASWLGADERPSSYDDVGRTGAPPSALARLGLSRYERVLRSAVAGSVLTMRGAQWEPVRVRGWSRVMFRRIGGGASVTLPLDALLPRT